MISKSGAAMIGVYLASLLGLSSVAFGATCKCTPNSSCWPAPSDWSALNDTVSGKLIRGVPPASVCYPGQPNYNTDACAAISQAWFNSDFHAEDPISIDYPIWANNSCNPIFPNGTSLTGDVHAGANGCTIGRYPVYVVNATGPEQIANAVKWAGKKNVRLVVKNTGHNYPGRNTGFGSLSIWTHNLRGMTFHENFKPSNCQSKNTGNQMAMTIAAGERDFAVYEEAAKHNAIVVGGSNPSVGIAGWFQGGGHGPLSSSYGMGADNLLEAKVVTPTGDIVTASECQHSDLFYALRGGGGGTWGIVTEVVMKAFPSPQTSVLLVTATVANATAPNASSRWWKLMADLHAEMPRLKDAGAQGYYGMVGPPIAPSLSLIWGTYHFDTPNATINEIYAPVKAKFDSAADFVQYTTEIRGTGPFFYVYSAGIGPEPVASGGSAMGSRLLTRKALTENVANVAATFEQIGPKAGPGVDIAANTVLLGHFIANDKNRDLDIGLNPAWRDAVTHLVVVEGWEDGSPQSEIQAVYDDVTYNKTLALRQLAPDSGAYFNEADPFEPDWQWAFFGKNYQRLRKTKKSYDPDGVLWCRSCVGSEEWAEAPDGTLCRVPWAEQQPKNELKS